MTARKRDLTGEPRLLLDYQHLAHALSISVAQAKELAAAGELVKVKIGARVLFDVDDVKAYIKRIKSAA